MSTLRDLEQALQRDPTQMEPFLALRKAYREAGKFDKLVTLYELRGQALQDRPKAAELFYLAAEIRIDQLGDTEGAEADLAHAVDREPGHLKAIRRLKLIYREQGRLGDYLTALELEGAAVAKTKEPAKVAELETELSQLWNQHLAKIERALNVPAPHRQAEATPENLRLIESARKIYRAFGDFQRVVRLFEIELGLITDPKRRADLLLALGRVLAEKVGDLQGAAHHIGEVVRLRPRDDKALEALAAVYAHPSWSEPDGRDRAAGIFHQLARRRQEAGDVDGAVATLRKALGVLPGQPEASELLERVLYDADRLRDLDLYYRERVAAAQAEDERMDFLFKRAQLAEGDLGEPEEARRIYEEIVAIEPPGGPASERLAQIYDERQDYAKLAALRERQLEAVDDPAARVAILHGLATLHRDRLGDPEQAAVYWHALLQVDPGHAEALEAYAEHFRQRGDWQALVDLLDFSFEHARLAGLAREDLLARLEEIAVISERNLGDAERALSAWQRMEELAPGHDRAREAQKRILQKAKQWDRMVTVLEREADSARDPAQKVDLLRRLARVHVEKLGATDRAVAVYRQILEQDPRDPVAIRAIVEVFEKEERWAELAQFLRSQAETSSGRQEKLATLRRLLALYDERLGDLVEGSWAATEILKVAPGDREALERLEAILERSNDKARLAQTLEYHTKYAAGPEEKTQLARRIAQLHQDDLGDLAAAATWWEEVLVGAPADGAALDALATVYDRLGKSEELARVLELQIERLEGDADAVTAAEYLRRLARISSGALAQPARALRAWESLVRVLPADPEALDALAEIYRAKGDFRALADVLSRQVPLASDPFAAVALALDRARLFEEELGDPAEAVRALEEIVATLDPRSREAYARLRRLYEARGDWERVVGVAEKQLFLAEEAEERRARALEIGILTRDRLGDERRAIAALERAAELDATGTQALEALADLYRRTGDSQRLVFTDEKLLAAATEPAIRRRLMFEIADTAAGPLGDASLAFEWVRRAFGEAPDDEALGRLERLAAEHRLWEELIAVYEAARTRGGEGADPLALARKIARIAEEELGDPVRAFAVLREALAAELAAETLLPELERLADEARDFPGLLDVYARVGRARPGVPERVDLLKRRATLREERLGDPSGALDELLRSFALQPENEATQAEILRLAERTKRWEDALSVQGQLFARAAEVSTKVEVAARAAALVETKVRDPLRAFRAYLNAFRLAPEDEGIVAHLWRLAALIAKPATPTVVIAPTPVAAEPAPAAEAPAEDAGRAEGLGDERGDDEENDVEVLEEIEEFEEIEEEIEPAAAAKPAGSPWEEFAHAYELLSAADDETRRARLLRVAEIWDRGARDADRALGSLERAFALDPTNGAVRAELRRIAERDGRWDDVCAIYLRAAERAPRDEAVALHHEVARVREALGQLTLAEDRYRAILALKPDHEVALDRLETMLRDDARWADLASLLEKRTTGALEALPPGALRRRKSFELAELYEQKLERPYEAIDTLERYVSGGEEDERGGDHVDVLAENRAAYAALARLYTRVGMAGKAVDALRKEGDLTADAATRRSLRIRMADLEERELGLGAKAIGDFEAILEMDPEDAEALAALDRLYEAHGRFEPLQRILETRADLAPEPERSELIRRRARLLEEKLGNPEGAAAALRALGTSALQDEETTAALLRNLRRAGLFHEAAKLLEQRLEIVSAAGAPADRLCALHLEVAALRLQELGDAEGARAAIERALAARPDSLEALDALAKVHLARNDFAAYAGTRRRQAESGSADARAAGWLLEAGRVFRDQVEDAASAKACFERAIEAAPAEADAARSLAALLVAEGDPAAARALLEGRLPHVDGPAARAALLTDLARVVWDGGGGAAEVLVPLEEALALAPDHVPAVMAIADVYYKEQQWTDAERRLLQVLRRYKGQPAEMARLYHRLAEIYGKLGRVEEGHRQLLEADRIAPGQLVIRLALGENRFQAKRWRDAIAHLEGIAEHPDAAIYADEVAQGLARAAHAEAMLKRPDRAVLLYEAALHLQPEHRASLEALADLALERGDRAGAAAHLRRLANVVRERPERVKLLDRLGDVLEALGDEEGARRAYEEAVTQIERPDEAHVPLLEKTLERQRGAGATAEASDTAQRLIDLIRDPKERAERRRQAALLVLEQGDAARAAEYLEKAHGESPDDEAVLALLGTAYERLGRAAEIEPLLARTLPGLPAIEDDLPARRTRAELWERLGRLRTQGDATGAIVALEQAIEVDPDRTTAREALVALYGGRGEHADAALRNHRALVAADVTRTASLRALAEAYARQGRVDAARCCIEALELFEPATDDDRAFLASHPVPDRKPEDPYAATIDEAERARTLVHPEAQVMAEVFAAIWEGIPGLAGATLDALGVGAAEKVSPLSDLTVGKIYGQVAKALGNKRTSLYVGTAPGGREVVLTIPPPPAIVLGRALADEAAPAELRFRLGRALELTRPEFILAAAMPPKEFAHLFASVLKAFHPRHSRWRAATGDAAIEQAAKLKKTLPYKVAKRLAELFQENDATPFSSARWRTVVHETGNRAGLLVCGDLRVAAEIVLAEGPSGGGQMSATDPAQLRDAARKPGPVRDLLRYALSDEYFSLRESLGTSVRSAAAA